MGAHQNHDINRDPQHGPSREDIQKLDELQTMPLSEFKKLVGWDDDGRLKGADLAVYELQKVLAAKGEHGIGLVPLNSTFVQVTSLTGDTQKTAETLRSIEGVNDKDGRLYFKGCELWLKPARYP
jgi:hypothetical protein